MKANLLGLIACVALIGVSQARATDITYHVKWKWGTRWRLALYLAALWVAIPLAATHAQTPQPPQPPTEHPRPSAEQRRAYEERMTATHPAKPGCYQAHYPDEHWVETTCLPRH
jgi:hypothetical protein